MKKFFFPRTLKLLVLITGCFLIQFLSGCFSETHCYPTLPTTPAASYPVKTSMTAGDVVEVKFFYTPQLNEVQTVRPDGKIALQLIGEVDTLDKTPSELRTELTKLYTPFLKDPNVTVIVRSFYNRRVFVGGQVTKPGLVEMPTSLTALEAIIQAGGFDMKDAEVRNVIIIRHKGSQRYAYSINFKPFLDGKGVEPFPLEPQDIIYVPRTEIAKADQWVDQHINKLIPLTGFIFTTQSGNSTIGLNLSQNR